MAARPSSLVSSGKAWGGSRKGVGRCGGQTDPSPPAALAAMGPGLLFPLLLLRALGAPGSELDAGGRHVCKASSRLRGAGRLPGRRSMCETRPLSMQTWILRSPVQLPPVRDGTAMSRMKLQVWEALTSSLGSALPCGSLSSHKLPWVTVSHHDPEIPFNHSFIEPPSAGWASDDSFSSDSESGEEDEGPAYCVPPQEGMVSAAPAESSEASLAGGPFPPPEDASTPFAIPRTSSLARAKRPSVSFAEGTKFAPQSRRGSGELSSPLRKPKRLSRGTQPGPESQEIEEPTGPQVETDGAPPGTASPRDSAAGRRRLPLGGRTVAERVEAIEGSVQESSGSVSTIYMLAGTPRGPEGPVRSVLRRFGSFQRGQAEPKVKSAIPKPPRRALSRNRGSPRLDSGSAHQSPSSAMKEELTGALESAGTGSEEGARSLGGGIKSSGGGQEVAPEDGPLGQDPQKVADEEGQEEPQYENVVPISGPPDP
uniref:Scavenger receptor class F member 1 n=1 Tax=Capra hircus TaxID=9925 RepID=A0A8C2RSU5_CAPHI